MLMVTASGGGPIQEARRGKVVAELVAVEHDEAVTHCALVAQVDRAAVS